MTRTTVGRRDAAAPGEDPPVGGEMPFGSMRMASLWSPAGAVQLAMVATVSLFVERPQGQCLNVVVVPSTFIRAWSG